MKKGCFLFLLVIVWSICINNIAIADVFTLHNGVKFGMSVNEVKQIESNLTFTDGRQTKPRMLTVKFICDRGVSHELVRHRMASFAQESTRYCNYSNEKFGEELTFVKPPWIDEKLRPISYQKYTWDKMSNEEKIVYLWYGHCGDAERTYLEMLEYGSTPQEARCVLPNSLKTEVVMTANYREWRHILDLRCSEKAHPQMRELMLPLLNELHERIPVIFDDLAAIYLDDVVLFKLNDKYGNNLRGIKCKDNKEK